MSKGIVILLCVVAVIIGTAIGMLVNDGLIGLSPKIFPFPDGLSSKNMNDLNTYYKTAPFGANVLVWLAHWGQAFFGAIVAALIAPKNKISCALIVGVLSLIGGIIMMTMIPDSAIWFKIIDILGYLPFAWLGAKIVGYKGVKAN